MDAGAPGFVDREAELEDLEDAVQDRGAVLYRLVGRRRIGKTALLAELCRKRDGVYLFVPEGDEGRLLAELRSQAGAATGEDLLPPEGWEGLLRFLERFEGRPVILDEFQHLLEASPTAVSLLQKAWDTRLRRGDHKWFLSGSSIGMMRRLTSGTTGALFGRLTHDRRLRPFTFREVALLYPGMDPEETLLRYAVFGGTPHYHGLSRGRGLEDAVRRSFLRDAAPFREEPLDLLRYELKVPARYHGILEAIGNGKRDLEDIKDYLHLRRVGDITRYIGYLRDDLGLIVEDAPVPEARRAKRFRLDDPFFDFYYRLIGPHLPMLELGGQDLLWRRIRQELPALAGPVAERVAHQLMVQRNGATLAGAEVAFERIGRWWGPAPGERARTLELDLVATGRKAAWVGEVKWRSRPVGPDVWGELVERAAMLRLPVKPTLLLVSRSGFTPKCRDAAPEGALLMDGPSFLREVVAPTAKGERET